MKITIGVSFEHTSLTGFSRNILWKTPLAKICAEQIRLTQPQGKYEIISVMGQFVLKHAVVESDEEQKHSTYGIAF